MYNEQTSNFATFIPLITAIVGFVLGLIPKILVEWIKAFLDIRKSRNQQQRESVEKCIEWLSVTETAKKTGFEEFDQEFKKKLTTVLPSAQSTFYQEVPQCYEILVQIAEVVDHILQKKIPTVELTQEQLDVVNTIQPMIDILCWWRNTIPTVLNPSILKKLRFRKRISCLHRQIF